MLINLDWFYYGLWSGVVLIVAIIAVKLTVDTIKELGGK